MSIRIKIAQTEKEIDDALWVRHEVLVIEDGKFGGKPFPGERLIDRFDVFPGVYHVIAYDGDEPIATIRLNRECHFGVPADNYFDFSAYRAEADAELAARNVKRERDAASSTHESGGAKLAVESSAAGHRAESRPAKAILSSAGMLAVRESWRRRRDVIRAMYKVAAGVCTTSGTTHIVVIVNHKTEGMYRRLGFRSLSGPIWSDEIENHIVPLAASTVDFYQWAFGDLRQTPLGAFKDSFERLFVRANDHVFMQGDVGNRAYIIAEGSIDISRRGPTGDELTLAHLTRGQLFGELALIDSQPRSATATASADTELITLDHHAFTSGLAGDPNHIDQVLVMFSERLRKMDEMLMVHAYSPEIKRLDFALTEAKVHTTPDRRDKGVLVFNGGPAALASRAGVDVCVAQDFLQERRVEGELEFSNQRIRFLR